MARAARSGHFPCLDGLRAIAALSVLVGHAAVATGLDARSRPAGDWLGRLGMLGVAVFFALSGFLLYRPFVAAHLGEGPFPSMGRYFVRRVARIYPAYVVALTVVILFGWHGPHRWSDLLRYYTLTHLYDTNLVVGAPISQAWSLAVEVSFYVALPLFAYAVARVGRAWASSARGRVSVELAAVAGVYAAAAAYRFAVVHGSPSMYGVRLQLLPGTMDWFAVGMVLAVASVWAERAGHLNRAVGFLADHPVVSWALAFEVYWLIVRIGIPSIGGGRPVQLMLRGPLYGAVAFLLLVPASFGPAQRGLLRGMLRSRALVFGGLVSYGIFLWHEFVLSQIVDHFWVWLDAPFPTVVVLAVALATAAGAASYFLVERLPMRWSATIGAGDVSARGRTPQQSGSSPSTEPTNAGPGAEEPSVPSVPSVPGVPGAPSGPRRFDALDGLRALAALGVLVYHVTSVIGVQNARYTGVLSTELGNFCVAIFFVLSGFLLSLPFLRAHVEGRAAPRAPAYAVRRALRILPAYWLALAIVLFVLRDAKYRGWGDVVTFFSLGQVYRAGYSIRGLGAAWSLCIEVAFYAALPLLMWVLHRVGRRPTRIGRMRAAAVGLAVLVLASNGYRVLALEGPLRGGPQNPRMYWLFAYLDWFAAGMVLALAHLWLREGGRLPAPVAVLRRRPWIAWLAALDVYWLIAHIRPGLFVRTTAVQDLSLFPLTALGAALVVAPFALGAPRRGIGAFLQSRPLVWLGTISYGIYLWHPVVAHLVQRQVATGAFERNFVIVLVVVFSASVGIAAVSYYLLERPAMALARRVHAEGRANVPTRRVLPDTASAPRDDAYDDFPAGRSEAPAAVRVSSAPT